MAERPVQVLMVDDDEGEYVIVRHLLRAGAERYDLTWMANYEEGVAAILTSNYDVCLIDYRLGAKTGLELLCEVTDRSNYTPMILLTGEGGHSVDVTAAKSGAADYLLKGGLNAAMLERSIRYAIEHGRTLKALREAREAAESLTAAKSAFLATMSHEIRTPMNAILGMADLLWDSPLNAEQMQYVEVFRRAGSSLLALLNDILDVSKIEAGRLELEHVEFDIEEVVDHAIELTAVKARAKGIMLLSRLACSRTPLMGDPTRLRQVLINLLGNAVKFTAAGEVVLTLRNREPGKPGLIEFSVSDTGIGIPADKLAAIFDDFSQVDASTTRQYGGTGLGLGISRRLVEAMGGRLEVTSSLGQGSTFRFELQFELAAEDTCGVQAPQEGFNGKRVLLLSDHETSGRILRETLEGWGFDCEALRFSGDLFAGLAQAMAGENPYSLAVLDTSKTGSDGFDAATEIGRIARGLPVLLLASQFRPEDASRRTDAGISSYAVKPVTRSYLHRLVGDAITVRKVAEPNLSGRGKLGKEEPPRPARILVAEDSPDNRLLIQLYLKDCPYLLTFAEDGKAAVNQFLDSDSDLILMDLQMPVMDGLAATRAIRSLERERGAARSIPILALSASTSFQDAERSGIAGCDGHLSKPITKLDLLTAIEKYTWHMIPVAIERQEHLDPIKIEMQPGLEGIVPGYLASRKKEVPEMLALLGASDFGRLAVLGHQLKGSGGGYGFPDLTRLGAAMEESAKQQDRKAIREQLIEMSNYLNHVQLIGEGIIGNSTPAGSA